VANPKAGSEPPRVTATVMAHPKRTEWAEQLADKIGCGITWDVKSSVWDTFRRSLLAHDEHATHHLIVQDDAIVCRDLLETAHVAAANCSGYPVSFTAIAYKLELHKDKYIKTFRAGGCWYPIRRGLATVSLMVPVVDIPDLLRTCDRMVTPHDDVRVSAHYRQLRRPILLSVPSLVNHRNPSESPSLVGNGRGRVARDVIRFVGAETSGLSVDWKPYVLP
jgi:hypothetical protein